ncbi:MAG: hypothetical protein ACYSWZ_13005 [Planctomycetota bacterium]|jgi:hypothetical protein
MGNELADTNEFKHGTQDYTIKWSGSGTESVPYKAVLYGGIPSSQAEELLELSIRGTYAHIFCENAKLRGAFSKVIEDQVKQGNVDG